MNIFCGGRECELADGPAAIVSALRGGAIGVGGCAGTGRLNASMLLRAGGGSGASRFFTMLVSIRVSIALGRRRGGK